MRGFTDKMLILLPIADAVTEPQRSVLSKSLATLATVIPERWGMEVCVFDFTDIYDVINVPDTFSIVKSSSIRDEAFVTDVMGHFLRDRCDYEFKEIFDKATKKYPMPKGVDVEERWSVVENRRVMVAMHIARKEFKVVFDLQGLRSQLYLFKKKAPEGIYIKFNLNDGCIVESKLNNEPKAARKLLAYFDCYDPMYTWTTEGV